MDRLVLWNSIPYDIFSIIQFGFPFSTHKLKVSNWDGIVQKINRKLAELKGKYVFVGRLGVPNSILSKKQVYFMTV